MSFFALLSLFAQPQYRWVDQTEKISMGLTFVPFHAIESNGPSSNYEDIVFVDLDQDGDEDMLRCGVPGASFLEVFENVLTPTGRLWKANSSLIAGIDCNWKISWIGACDLNGDEKKEILIPSTSHVLTYINIGQPGSSLWECDSTFFGTAYVSEPNFADIDGDGDFDMAGSGPVFWWNKGNLKRPIWQSDTTYFPKDENEREGEQPVWIDWDADGIWDILFAREMGFADPPPNPWGYILLHNTDSPTNPKWEYESVDLGGGGFPASCFSFLDWNNDGTEDVLIQGADYDGGYLYHQGKRTSTGLSFRTLPTLTWGGIVGTCPNAADVNADKSPEITVSEQELHYGLGSWYIIYYYYPHFRHYSSVYNQGPQLNCYSGNAYCFERDGYEADGFVQYVDFDRDNLQDYVMTIIIKGYDSPDSGFQMLYRNVGIKTEPKWMKDTSALSNLPPLFPSCFLDIDQDRDMDVVGIPVGDSTLAGYVNTRSDDDPNYMRYDVFVSGLEGLSPTFMSAADINDDGYTDLAVGLEDDVVAYFNTGQANPRWERHDEVFASIPGSGNPCLCDGDGDGDLDLFIVQSGRLRYYRNASNEPGVAEEPIFLASPITVNYMGHEAVIVLSLTKPQERLELYLYNAAGQRVRKLEATSENGKASFVIAEQPGVYFFRVLSGTEEFKGKVLIY